MAGSTTNIGLIKPTYSEDADVAIINENMDTLDSTISALDNGLAIVSNNNTHGAITAGQYVYVRNHGSLAEGMYTANSNIAANATLSSSNLTAVSSGSLNKLNSDISALNSKLDYKTLLNGETVTSTSTNKTLYNGRKFSDYKLILAIVKRSNIYRASMMIPIGLFTTGTETLLFEVDSIITQRWYDIVYINDTTVAIQCSENANSNSIIYLYGVL